MDNESSAEPKKAFLSMKTKVLGAVLAIALAGGGGYYLYAHGPAKDPQKTAQQEAEKLVAAVGKLMVLPSDELPIVATVADPSKLTDQPFFAKAKKGDKVLIFNTARKAVLYDPVADRIIDVAPLSTGSKNNSQ